MVTVVFDGAHMSDELSMINYHQFFVIAKNGGKADARGNTRRSNISSNWRKIVVKSLKKYGGLVDCMNLSNTGHSRGHQ